MAVGRYAWWVEITAGVNDQIRAETTALFTATIPAGRYYPLADGSASDLLRRVELALEAADPSGAPNWSVTMAATGGSIISVTSVPVGAWLRFNDALTTFDEGILGFRNAAYNAGAGVPMVAPDVSSRLWAPTLDYVNDTYAYKENQVTTSRAVSGQRRSYRWGQYTRREVEHDVLLPAYVYDADEAAAPQNTAFEHFWDWASAGRDFYFVPDVNTPGTYTRMVVPDEDWMASMDNAIERQGHARIYRVTVPMETYVV